MINDVRLDIAWAAGFWEGEGWTGVHTTTRNSGHVYKFAKVGAAQKCSNPLLKLQTMFGGNICLKKSKIYQWELSVRKCEKFLWLIRPHIQSNIKLNQIDKVLKWYASTGGQCDI